MGTLKCCQVPKVSTNFTSTILAPCLRAISITLLGVLMLVLFSVVYATLLLSRAVALTASLVHNYWRNGALNQAVVAFLPVLGQIQADGFHFFRLDEGPTMALTM